MHSRLTERRRTLKRKHRHFQSAVICSLLIAGAAGITVSADDSGSETVGGSSIPAVVTGGGDQASADKKSGTTITYTASGSDPDADLKEKVINYYSNLIKTSDNDSAKAVSTSYSATPLDKTRTDIQPVTIDLSMTAEDGTVLYSTHEIISVQIQAQSSSGVLFAFKSGQMKVDYQGQFSYMSNVTLVPDKSGVLPVISETDNVDASKEGSYTCTVSAVNSIGDTETKSFTVIVAKPFEVIEKEKEEAAAAAAAAEAAKQAELERQMASIAAVKAQAELDEQKENTPAIAYSSGDASPTAENILRIARSCIGGRYVWGGNDPRTGVDCSGFTKWVFAQVGIPLNRTAASQALNGYQVSAADARPGDLVIWSGHVGIYSGNGMMINAENPSRGIREDSLSGFQADGYFMGYYRIPGVN